MAGYKDLKKGLKDQVMIVKEHHTGFEQNQRCLPAKHPQDVLRDTADRLVLLLTTQAQ